MMVLSDNTHLAVRIIANYCPAGIFNNNAMNRITCALPVLLLCFFNYCFRLSSHPFGAAIARLTQIRVSDNGVVRMAGLPFGELEQAANLLHNL